MGNNICTDSHLRTIEELEQLSITLQKYNNNNNNNNNNYLNNNNNYNNIDHNIRAFSFHHGPGNGSSAVIQEAVPLYNNNNNNNININNNNNNNNNLLLLDPSKSYVVCHITRSKINKMSPPKNNNYKKPKDEFLLFAENCNKIFTPRGIRGIFGIDVFALKCRFNNNNNNYLINNNNNILKNSNNNNVITSDDNNNNNYIYHYKLYLYNGKRISPLVGAVAVMNAFSLERLLNNNRKLMEYLFYNCDLINLNNNNNNNNNNNKPPVAFGDPIQLVVPCAADEDINNININNINNINYLNNNNNNNNLTDEEITNLYKDHSFLRGFYNMLTPTTNNNNNNNYLNNINLNNNNNINKLSDEDRTLISKEKSSFPPVQRLQLSRDNNNNNLNNNNLNNNNNNNNNNSPVKSTPPPKLNMTKMTLNLPSLSNNNNNNNNNNINYNNNNNNKEEEEDEEEEDYNNTIIDRKQRLKTLLPIASEIINNYLYVGGETASEDLNQLLLLGITNIINAAAISINNKYLEYFEYLSLFLCDSPDEEIEGLFPVVIKVIEDVVNNNNNNNNENEKKEEKDDNNNNNIPKIPKIGEKTPNFNIANSNTPNLNPNNLNNNNNNNLNNNNNNTGKVFIHCHQGVSRSTTLVISYLMWKYGISLSKALLFIKEKRSIVSPNTGFLVRLMHWGKHLCNPIQGIVYGYFPLGEGGLFCFREINNNNNNNSEKKSENFEKNCGNNDIINNNNNKRRVVVLDSRTCYVSLIRNENCDNNNNNNNNNNNSSYKCSFYGGPDCPEIIREDALKMFIMLRKYIFYTNNNNNNDNYLNINNISKKSEEEEEDIHFKTLYFVEDGSDINIITNSQKEEVITLFQETFDINNNNNNNINNNNNKTLVTISQDPNNNTIFPNNLEEIYKNIIINRNIIKSQSEERAARRRAAILEIEEKNKLNINNNINNNLNNNNNNNLNNNNNNNNNNNIDPVKVYEYPFNNNPIDFIDIDDLNTNNVYAVLISGDNNNNNNNNNNKRDNTAYIWIGEEYYNNNNNENNNIIDEILLNYQDNIINMGVMISSSVAASDVTEEIIREGEEPDMFLKLLS